MSANANSSPSLDSMHDKCKQVILFHNNLCNFFKALKGVLPECSTHLKQTISKYKQVPRVDYITHLKSLMEPHIKYISEYDEGIFTDDYKPGGFELLPDLNFRVVWELLNSADFDDELRASTKTKVFNHLQTLYISACMGLEQIGAFNKNMEKQKTMLMNMIENLKIGDEVKKRMEEMKQTEEEAASKSGSGLGALGGLGGLAGLLGSGSGAGGLPDLDKISDLFGEDNFVFQIAKDIVSELDMGSDELDGPMESIMSLFANNGKKIQDLIIKVGDKLESKLASGEIDKERLFKDAQKMKDKLSTVAPGLSDMINDSGLNMPIQKHYESMSPEDQELYSDIPGILEKPFGDRTAEEHQRCMSMPGFSPMDATEPKSKGASKKKANKKK
jgi:hypothetical protein